MPRTRAAHRLPSGQSARHLQASAGHGPFTGPRLAILGGGIAALCVIGAGMGVHAALGDGDGPAVQLANRGVDLRPETSGGDGAATGDGSAAGSRDGTRGLPATTLAPLDPTAPPSSTAPPRTTAPPVASPPATNPYLDPASPQYVPEADRVAWLEGQQRVRECMTAAGYEYLDWQWWEGGSPKPAGLDESAATAWEFALQGDEGSAGCAVEAGDAPVPPDGAVPPEESAPPPESGDAPAPPESTTPDGTAPNGTAPDSTAPEASVG